jgi:hypothetical protein
MTSASGRLGTRRTAMPRNWLMTTGAAAVLLLALGGCGSESSDGSSNDAGGGDPGFDVSTATLTDQQFCGTVDVETVATVLGMSNSDVNLLVDREVGDKYEGPNEEAAPLTAEANLCTFGSSTKQFVVSVQPGATAADVKKTTDDLTSLSGKGSSETCKSSDAAAYGDPAGAFTCTSGPPVKRVRVVATGLVGDSKFYCSAIVNEGAGSDFPSATFDACQSILGSLAD